MLTITQCLTFKNDVMSARKQNFLVFLLFGVLIVGGSEIQTSIIPNKLDTHEVKKTKAECCNIALNVFL